MRRFSGWSFLVVVALFATLIAASAFGASTTGGSRAAKAGPGSQTFTVNVDGKNKAVNESFDAYFPNIVTAHAGDTVVFHYVGVGEPHTVTLGSLASHADTVFDALTAAEQSNPPRSALAADAKLPQLTNQNGSSVVPVAADPCVESSGVPSVKARCPSTAKPAFDGHQAYYNSGWLKANETFTVHLASSTPPGTYRFMCLIHREDAGDDQGRPVEHRALPSPAAQFATGQKQLAKTEAVLAGPAKLLAQGKPPIPGLSLPGAHPILVGSGAPRSAHAGQIDQFGPRTVHILVGGAVTRWLGVLHTITFNSTNADNASRPSTRTATSRSTPGRRAGGRAR